eukprot:754380-Hanusia_phi.AAC.3
MGRWGGWGSEEVNGSTTIYFDSTGTFIARKWLNAWVGLSQDIVSFLVGASGQHGVSFCTAVGSQGSAKPSAGHDLVTIPS